MPINYSKYKTITALLNLKEFDFEDGIEDSLEDNHLKGLGEQKESMTPASNPVKGERGEVTSPQNAPKVASAPERLYNSNNDFIGSLRDSGSRLWLHNKNGSKLGYYDKKENRTYNTDGKFIGKGNILTTLLRE